jgi:hypothetical protein
MREQGGRQQQRVDVISALLDEQFQASLLCVHRLDIGI